MWPAVLPGLRATHMKHVYDFYKPELHSEYPQVDGPLSVECYLSALDICYERYRQKFEGASTTQTISSKGHQNRASSSPLLEGGPTSATADANSESDMTSLTSRHRLSLKTTFDAILFHTPFCKIVQKSLGRLMLSEYLNQLPHSANDPQFEKLAKFELVKFEYSHECSLCKLSTMPIMFIPKSVLKRETNLAALQDSLSERSPVFSDIGDIAETLGIKLSTLKIHIH